MNAPWIEGLKALDLKSSKGIHQNHMLQKLGGENEHDLQLLNQFEALALESPKEVANGFSSHKRFNWNDQNADIPNQSSNMWSNNQSSSDGYNAKNVSSTKPIFVPNNSNKNANEDQYATPTNGFPLLSQCSNEGVKIVELVLGSSPASYKGIHSLDAHLMQLRNELGQHAGGLGRASNIMPNETSNGINNKHDSQISNVTDNVNRNIHMKELDRVPNLLKQISRDDDNNFAFDPVGAHLSDAFDNSNENNRRKTPVGNAKQPGQDFGFRNNGNISSGGQWNGFGLNSSNGFQNNLGTRKASIGYEVPHQSMYNGLANTSSNAYQSGYDSSKQNYGTKGISIPGANYVQQQRSNDVGVNNFSLHPNLMSQAQFLVGSPLNAAQATNQYQFLAASPPNSYLVNGNNSSSTITIPNHDSNSKRFYDGINFSSSPMTGFISGTPPSAVAPLYNYMTQLSGGNNNSFAPAGIAEAIVNGGFAERANGNNVQNGILNASNANSGFQNNTRPEYNNNSSKATKGGRRQNFDKPRSRLLEDFRNNRCPELSLMQVEGHVVEFSKDQHGSRFIQQKLESANYEEKCMVFNEVMPALFELSTDVFANYVIQKFLDCGTLEQRIDMGKRIRSDILRMSLQMYGCRVVQKVLERDKQSKTAILPEGQRDELAFSLKCDIVELVRDQNGNHVVQKALQTVDPQKMDFVCEAIRGRAKEVSLHTYGCRVVQRMMENLSEKQMQPILTELMDYTEELSKNEYGNYVIQHILEHGSDDLRAMIVRSVKGSVYDLCFDKYASNVIEKAISKSTPAQSNILIEEILTSCSSRRGEAFLKLLNNSYGNYVVQTMINVANDQMSEMLFRYIEPHKALLSKGVYGKHILQKMEKFGVTSKDNRYARNIMNNGQLKSNRFGNRKNVRGNDGRINGQTSLTNNGFKEHQYVNQRYDTGMKRVDAGKNYFSNGVDTYGVNFNLSDIQGM